MRTKRSMAKNTELPRVWFGRTRAGPQCFCTASVAWTERPVLFQSACALANAARESRLRARVALAWSAWSALWSAYVVGVGVAASMVATDVAITSPLSTYKNVSMSLTIVAASASALPSLPSSPSSASPAPAPSCVAVVSVAVAAVATLLIALVSAEHGKGLHEVGPTVRRGPADLPRDAVCAMDVIEGNGNHVAGVCDTPTPPRHARM